MDLDVRRSSKQPCSHTKHHDAHTPTWCDLVAQKRSRFECRSQRSFFSTKSTSWRRCMKATSLGGPIRLPRAVVERFCRSLESSASKGNETRGSTPLRSTAALLGGAISGRSESCFMRAPGRLVTDLMNAAAVALEERPFSLASAEPLGSWACHLASMPCECSVWNSMLPIVVSPSQSSMPYVAASLGWSRSQQKSANSAGVTTGVCLLGIGVHSSSRQRSPSVPNDCARESSRESTLGTAKRDRLCTYSSGHL